MSNKRKLIDELIQGVDAMRAHREGKSRYAPIQYKTCRRCRLTPT